MDVFLKFVFIKESSDFAVLYTEPPIGHQPKKFETEKTTYNSSKTTYQSFTSKTTSKSTYNSSKVTYKSTYNLSMATYKSTSIARL